MIRTSQYWHGTVALPCLSKTTRLRASCMSIKYTSDFAASEVRLDLLVSLGRAAVCGMVLPTRFAPQTISLGLELVVRHRELSLQHPNTTRYQPVSHTPDDNVWADDAPTHLRSTGCMHAGAHSDVIACACARDRAKALPDAYVHGWPAEAGALVARDGVGGAPQRMQADVDLRPARNSGCQ